jgi:hypothetical protein
MLDDMRTGALDRLCEFARSRDCECEIVRDEARIYLPKTSIRARTNEAGELTYRIWFGRMPAAYEMTLSLSLFTALLIFALLNGSDKSHPYLPYLAIVVLVGNAHFEFSRLRRAKNFVADAQQQVI